MISAVQTALASRWTYYADADARDRLVHALQPYIYKVAHSFHRPELFDDLAQAGNVGLLRALDVYDPARGTPIVAHASRWVFGAMYRCCRTMPAVVRGAECVSLDAPIGDDTDEMHLDRLEATTPTPERCAVDAASAVVVREAVGHLSAAPCEVIRRRWLDGDGSDLRTVGEEMGISHELARRHEASAMRGLWQRLRMDRRAIEILDRPPGNEPPADREAGQMGLAFWDRPVTSDAEVTP